MIGGGGIYRGGVEYIRYYGWIKVLQQWGGPLDPASDPLFFQWRRWYNKNESATAKQKWETVCGIESAGRGWGLRMGVLDKARAESGKSKIWWSSKGRCLCNMAASESALQWQTG